MAQSNLKLRWTILGAIALASFPYVLETIVGDLVTMPIYFLFLLILLSVDYYVVFLLFPLVYIIYTPLVSKSDKFGKITFMLILTVVVLNTIFILQFFEYWGKPHTGTIIIVNLFTSVVALSFSYIGWKKNYLNLQYAANLILFFMVSWATFPYLGEVP